MRWRHCSAAGGPASTHDDRAHERRQARILAGAWLLVMLLLAGTLAAANLRWPTPFEQLIAIAWPLPLGLVYAISNADLIARLEQENATRAELLVEVRAAHQIESRILNDLADDLHDTVLADSKAIEMPVYPAAAACRRSDRSHVAASSSIGCIVVAWHYARTCAGSLRVRSRCNSEQERD